ncbi:MAG: hypothetical protein IJE79_01565 [Alphaproteobacteria bacterium]|nr:hypothetical protein [Alphaproteobacteria bacterium]
MKKLSLLILPILIGLTACSDKPVFVQNGFFCNGAEEGKPTTDIKLYKNYAIITTNGTDIKLGNKTVYDNDSLLHSISYSNADNKLEFLKIHEYGLVRIKFILNNSVCFWQEVEVDKPYQHLQSKKIDEKTEKQLKALFK